MTLPAFYPILDAGVLRLRSLEVAAVAEELLAAGTRLLQYRVKGHFGREEWEIAQQLHGWCEEAGARLVINDRADLAALLDAGLHLGQDDLPPVAARRVLGGQRMLGYSTHNAEQLAAAQEEPADYFALGPIFGTQSKERPDPVVGIAQLTEWRRLATRPLVAIGGLRLETARAVKAAGADAQAVIGDLYPPGATLAEVRRRAQDWLLELATVG